jgi:hypothetical protein
MKLRIRVTSLLISAGLGWAQKPIQLADILSWKRIQAPAVSNDGEWLAYRVSALLPMASALASAANSRVTSRPVSPRAPAGAGGGQ